MKQPFFTIVIPALNEEKYLPNLFESLCVQTWKDFEVIVVDGSSKDKTVDVAKHFDTKLPSLHVVISKKASLPLQRNIGAQHAKGGWYIFIDADSVLLPYCLERLAVFIKETNARFITTWGKPDSEKVNESMHTLLYNLMLEGGLLFHRQLSPGPFTAVERNAFHAIRGYDETLQFGEDQNLSQRLERIGVDLYMLRETLYVWSLRRFRSYGFIRSTQIYIKAAMRILFTNTNYKHLPGYIMGGHVYDKQYKPLKRFVLRELELKLKKLRKKHT